MLPVINIFPSYFEPEGHTFCGMILKPFKTLAAHVLSGLKTLCYASRFITDKTLLLVF